MALLAQFNVLKVLAFNLAQRQQPIAGDAGLLDGAARVVDAVNDEQLGLEVLHEMDRAPVAPQVGVRFRMTHHLPQVILEMLHAGSVEPLQVADAYPGHGCLPDVWLSDDGYVGHVTPIGAAENAYPVRVHVRQ